MRKRRWRGNFLQDIVCNTQLFWWWCFSSKVLYNYTEIDFLWHRKESVRLLSPTLRWYKFIHQVQLINFFLPSRQNQLTAAQLWKMSIKNCQIYFLHIPLLCERFLRWKINGFRTSSWQIFIKIKSSQLQTPILTFVYCQKESCW